MFNPQCLPVLIGSLPLRNHAEAARIILQYTPEIPLWPQLPKIAREGMVRQFLTGFPGLVDDDKRCWINSDTLDFADQMTSFYEDYMLAVNDPDFLRNSRFRLDNDTTRGFSALLEVMDSQNHSPMTVKGQVTGPVTTGIGVHDQNGNSIFYDDNLRDMLVKHLTMKACWQVEELRKYTGQSSPIVFIDEPGIVSFGSSAFTGISRDMAADAVSEVIAGIRQSGGLSGIHICANGDFGPALTSATDIISFDAYSYFDNFILFKEQLIAFLRRGGILAWGIVPTGDPRIVALETTENLYSRWQKQMRTLSELGFSENELMRRTLIAPACGTGSLTPELAVKVLSMTREVSLKCQTCFSQG
jgi:hypothetical protein